MTRSQSTLKNTILIATFALLPFAAVHASAQNAAHVNVPFDFVANHQYVPAGNYIVQSSENAVTLISANTRKAEAILLTRKEAGDAIETRSLLEFYVSGSRHVLVEAQFAGSSMHSMLLGQPKKERMEARNTEPAGQTIEIAMK